MSKLSSWKTMFFLCVFCAAMAISSPATTTFTTLVNFNGTNGAYPYAMSLIQGTDGDLYGIFRKGGSRPTSSENILTNSREVLGGFASPFAQCEVSKKGPGERGAGTYYPFAPRRFGNANRQ